MKWIGLAIVLVMLSWPAVCFGDVVGRALLIDGDTLEIHGQRIRLYGIDAPESGQLCRADDRPYPCGQIAALALADKIGERLVRCEERDVDAYGRVVAICYLGDEDLGAWLILNGWAFAYRRYSEDYLDEEGMARSERRGIWQGEFEYPWEWRHGSEQEPNADPLQTSCVIKGNISKTGERIYHLPGQRDYDRTRIDPSQGERWFCTEEEAVSAGWRRAKR